MSSRDSNPGADLSRRTLLRAAVAGSVLIPLSALLGSGAARAAEKLSEDDPQAKALDYVHDASKSKNPKHQPGQFCKNCNLIQSDSGEWRPCAIFRDKLVHESGWCSAWVRKA